MTSLQMANEISRNPLELWALISVIPTAVFAVFVVVEYYYDLPITQS